MAAAGAAMSAKAAAETRKEAGRRVSAELARQEGYTKAGKLQLAETMSTLTPSSVQAETAEGAARYEQSYKEAQRQSGYQTVVEKETPETVQAGTEMSKDVKNVLKAQYMGLNEWAIRNLIRMRQAQQNIRTNAAMAQESARVLPFELQGAQVAGEDWQTAGTITSGLGQLVGTYGAMSGSSAAAPQVEVGGVPVDYNAAYYGQFAGQV